MRASRGASNEFVCKPSAVLAVQAFASFAGALAADGGHTETLMSCGRLYKVHPPPPPLPSLQVYPQDIASLLRRRASCVCIIAMRCNPTMLHVSSDILKPEAETRLGIWGM